MDPTLIFFAAMAAFLCYRLYTVLGTKGGHEPDEADRYTPAPVERPSVEDDQETVVRAPSDDRPVEAWVKTIREDHPEFDGNHFIEGAKSAYEMIVQAFASGDMSSIQDYLAPPVRDAFSNAIDARKTSGQSMDVTFVGIESAKVLSATRTGDAHEVVVAFQSDQIRVVKDSTGETIDGDPNRIDLVSDQWTFSRPVSSRDPNWVLLATDGAAPTNG